MEIRTGLAPLFRPGAFGLARRPAPPPDEPEPATPEPEPVAADEGLAEPEPMAAPVRDEPKAPERPRRRRLPGGAEALPPRQSLSDALGFWRDCGSKPCRRAKRCLGVRGAACLAEGREAAAAALRELGFGPNGA